MFHLAVASFQLPERFDASNQPLNRLLSTGYWLLSHWNKELEIASVSIFSSIDP